MYYFIIAIIMLLVVNIEATIFSVFFPILTGSNNFVVPNLAIIVLIFVCLIKDDKKIIYLAFIIGLVIDIVFGSYIGLYAFTYAFIAYWANVTFRIFIDRHVLVFILSILLAVASFELLVWGINTMFGLIDTPLAQAFDRYFFGSLILGIAVASVLYNPTITYLEKKGVSFYE